MHGLHERAFAIGTAETFTAASACDLRGRLSNRIVQVFSSRSGPLLIDRDLSLRCPYYYYHYCYYYYLLLTTTTTTTTTTSYFLLTT